MPLPRQEKTLPLPPEEHVRRALVPPKGAGMACEGCGEEKPIEQFGRYLQRAGDLDADTAPAQLCDYCSTYGPPLSDPFHQLTGKELRALEALASGSSIHAVAKLLKVSRSQLKRMLSGEDKPLFRAAYRRLLINAGVTPEKLIQRIAESMDATQRRWNAIKESYDEFPDHGTRLKAVAHAQKVLQLDSPSELAQKVDQRSGVTLNFVTNLDGKSRVEDEGYTIIDAEVSEG